MSTSLYSEMYSRLFDEKGVVEGCDGYLDVFLSYPESESMVGSLSWIQDLKMGRHAKASNRLSKSLKTERKVEKRRVRIRLLIL